MATYYITAVDKNTTNNHTSITRVLMHLVNENSVHIGLVYTKDQVIQLLLNNTIYSATWNYVGNYWIQGQRVTTENRSSERFLRTIADSLLTDNLLHLLPLSNLGL